MIFGHIIFFINTGLGIGLSGTWWLNQHNRHHAMPQRLKHDVDLDTLPYLAYNAKVVQSPSQGKTFMVKNQVCDQLTNVRRIASGIG